MADNEHVRHVMCQLASLAMIVRALFKCFPSSPDFCQDGVSEIMQQQLSCPTYVHCMLAAFNDATHNIIKSSLEKVAVQVEVLGFIFLQAQSLTCEVLAVHHFASQCLLQQLNMTPMDGKSVLS